MLPQPPGSTREIRPARASERVIRPPRFSPLAALRAAGDLARHRDLLYTLTVHRLRVRFKQSILGMGWAVLQPLATMAVFTIVFAYIARIPTEGMPYAVVALAGLVPWTCCSNAILTSTHSLAGQPQLVTRVYFPREILPVTYILAAGVDCLVAGALLVAVMLAYGVSPGPQLAAVIPILGVLLMLVSGIALAAAATQVRFRDVGVAMPIGLQLLMFASPVAYPLALVPERITGLYILNPMAGIVENFRRAVLGTEPLHMASLAIALVWAAAILPVGYAYFKWVESTAADLV